MREKTAAFALLMAFILLLTGCGRLPFPLHREETPPPPAETTPEPHDERKTDEEFVAALGRALQARWDLAAEYTPKALSELSAAEYQSYLRRCVAAEEAELGSILDYRFRDSDLADLAQQYYYALSLQREGAEYARTKSLTEYNRTWVLGYQYRVSTVYDLCQEFSLRVEEEYAGRLSELLAAHHEAKKQVAFQEFIDRLPQTLQYEKDPDRSDKTTTCYVGEITNTTDYDIKSLSVDISFYDKDGVILFQTSDWISNLHAGQSARSTIYAASGDYAGMEYAVSIYQ